MKPLSLPTPKNSAGLGLQQQRSRLEGSSQGNALTVGQFLIAGGEARLPGVRRVGSEANFVTMYRERRTAGESLSPNSLTGSSEMFAIRREQL